MQELAEGVYCKIDPDGRTNVGLIDCGDYLIFVDTTLFPSNTRAALAEARAITEKPFKFLVNTHFHPDHTFGNQEFSCTIVAQEGCPKLMKESLPAELARRIQTYPEDGKKKLSEIRLNYPTMTFDKDLVLQEHPLVKLIHMGGHTSDSSIVTLPETGVVFAGDLLFVGYHPFLEDCDFDEWLKALEDLKTLNPQMIVPGHGALTDGKGTDYMAEYLEAFRGHLTALKKEGCSKEELMKNPERLALPSRRRPERTVANIDSLYDRIPV